MVGNAAPLVTGISPNEGVPGTKVTIRGENLGMDKTDLHGVFIGEINIIKTVQWFSPKKLTGVTPLGTGELEITVVTESGRMGSSTVTYTQFAPKSVGAQEAVSYWPEDESKTTPAIIERSKSAQPYMQSDMLEQMAVGEVTRIAIPLSDEALRKCYPTGTGSTHLSESDFNPIMYLLKFYKNTSYTDLVKTYRSLKQSSSVSTQGDEPLSVVKANLYTIFQCLDSLEVLSSKLEEEVAAEAAQNRKRVEKELEGTLTECRDHSVQLFREVLRRKDYADSARTTLAVMQRFRFLFNLPHAIRENISKGEYNIVINDYLRAKALFGTTDVEVFKAVYTDVENVISSFKNFLKEKLMKMPTRFEDNKETIGYLNQLQVSYDPAWECLQNQRTWILDQIRKHLKAYSKDIENPSDWTPNTRQSYLPDGGVHSRPAAVTLVEEVCHVMADNYAEFWKLGSAYIAGQLKSKEDVGKKSQDSVMNERKKSFMTTNLEILQIVSKHFRSCLLDLASPELLTSGWIPHCIVEFRSCFSSLPLNDFFDDSKEVIAKLSHDLRKHCVYIIFRRAELDVDNLKFKESWTTEMTDAHGATTQLPLLYENIIIDAITLCKDFIKSRLHLEKDLLDSEEVCREFPRWCSAAMCAFARCLQCLADAIEKEPELEDVIRQRGESNASMSSVASCDLPQSYNLHAVSKSRGLILIVNNCQAALDIVRPRLLAQCRSQRYPGLDQVEVHLGTALETVHQSTLARYVDLKADPIYGPIEVQMTAGHFNWKEAPMPTGCRDYAKSIIRELCQVYSEVLLVSPRYAGPAMETMVVRVLEEVRRCLTSLGQSSWGRHGQLQVTLDLRLLEAALSRHVTQEARSLLNLITGAVVRRWSSQETQLMDQILSKEKARMKLLLDGLNLQE